MLLSCCYPISSWDYSTNQTIWISTFQSPKLTRISREQSRLEQLQRRSSSFEQMSSILVYQIFKNWLYKRYSLENSTCSKVFKKLLAIFGMKWWISCLVYLIKQPLIMSGNSLENGRQENTSHLLLG